MDVVNFKVFLCKNNANEKNIQEIRRFGIDVNVVSNFSYLREKLQTVFPELRGKRFRVVWKDAEGDSVVVSSCEELQIALTEMECSLLRKLYVVLDSSDLDDNPSVEFSNCNASSNLGVKHGGVVCDACDKPIYGFRYKCLQCPDYDLCTICEAKALHPEHYMIRMSVPLQWKPHNLKRLVRHINKFMRKASSCPFTEEETNEDSHPTDLYSQCYEQAMSWMNEVDPNIKKCANSKENVKSDESKSDTNDKKTNDPGTGSASQEAEIPGLDLFNKYIASYLKAFGVDVNIQVKTDKASQHNDTNVEKQDKSNDNIPSCSKNLNDEKQPETNDNSKIEEEMNNISPKQMQSNNENQGSNHFNDNGSVKADGWTLLDNNAIINSTVSENSTDNVNLSKNKEVPIEQNAINSNNPSLYPSLPVMDNLPHPNPEIQNGLTTMRQMGFTNDAAWLTQLLVLNNGDISKTLDMLLKR